MHAARRKDRMCCTRMLYSSRPSKRRKNDKSRAGTRTGGHAAGDRGTICLGMMDGEERGIDNTSYFGGILFLPSGESSVAKRDLRSRADARMIAAISCGIVGSRDELVRTDLALADGPMGLLYRY